MKGEDTSFKWFNDKHSAAPLHLEELLNEYLSNIITDMIGIY